MIPLSVVKKSNGHEVFRYSFESLSDLEPGADDGLDVICDGILNKKPYIYNDREQTR